MSNTFVLFDVLPVGIEVSHKTKSFLGLRPSFPWKKGLEEMQLFLQMLCIVLITASDSRKQQHNESFTIIEK